MLVGYSLKEYERPFTIISPPQFQIKNKTMRINSWSPKSINHLLTLYSDSRPKWEVKGLSKRKHYFPAYLLINSNPQLGMSLSLSKSLMQNLEDKGWNTQQLTVFCKIISTMLHRSFQTIIHVKYKCTKCHNFAYSHSPLLDDFVPLLVVCRLPTCSSLIG